MKTISKQLSLVRVPLIPIIFFAFFYAALSSTRGIDIDQMILYQAALKLLSGQIIYRDFYLPHGPVGALLLAFFMRISSTGGWGIVIASGVLNSFATFCIWQITKKNTSSFLYCSFAAMLTAVWFLPVFGMFYYDHLAYLFALIAFIFFAQKTILPVILSALFFVLSFHTKQTVGLPALTACVFAYLFVYGKSEFLRKRNVFFFLSYCAGHLLVFAFIAFYTDFSSYFLHTFTYPIDFSTAAGSDKNILNLFYSLFLPFKINPIEMLKSKGVGRLAFYPVVIATYFCYWAALKSTMEKKTRFALIFLLLSTLLSTALLGRLFAHVFFGMGGALMLCLSTIAWKQRTLLVTSIFVIFALIGVSYTHYLRPFIGTYETFYSNSDIEPIQVRASGLSKASKSIITFIRNSPGGIALLTDSAYLVPLTLKQAPLNPTVYYHEGLTIPLNADARRKWEESTVNAFETQNVKYVLVGEPLEEGIRPFSSTTELALPIPIIESYVASRYHPVVKELHFQLWQRN